MWLPSTHYINNLLSWNPFLSNLLALQGEQMRETKISDFHRQSLFCLILPPFPIKRKSQGITRESSTHWKQCDRAGSLRLEATGMLFKQLTILTWNFLLFHFSSLQCRRGVGEKNNLCKQSLLYLIPSCCQHNLLAVYSYTLIELIKEEKLGVRYTIQCKDCYSYYVDQTDGRLHHKHQMAEKRHEQCFNLVTHRQTWP